MARCVLPEPVPPIRRMFSRRAISSHLINSRIIGLFTEGTAAKSKASSALGVGNRAAFILRAAARARATRARRTGAGTRGGRCSPGAGRRHLLALGRHRGQLQCLEVVLREHRAGALEPLHDTPPAARLAYAKRSGLGTVTVLRWGRPSRQKRPTGRSRRCSRISRTASASATPNSSARSMARVDSSDRRAPAAEGP